MDSFTARLPFPGGFGIGQAIQVFLRKLDARPADAVVHPFALLAAHDDAGITENLHMVGQSRLADAHFLQQTASTLLPSAEQVQNPDTVFIAEGLENQSNLSLVHGTPPIDVYQYSMQ